MIDNVDVKGKKWEFDDSVANCFSNMLERSIPGYNTMRSLVFSIGQNYVKDKTTIVDVGCSNGIAIEPFVEKNGAYNNYLLLDVSEPMLDKCRKKFKGYIESGLVKVDNFDLRRGLEKGGNSLVLSILTIQFTPIEYRQKIVKSIYDSLIDGGAFIFVEKVLGNDSDLDSLLVSEYYKIKSENQYTQEQIQDKRKSLEGVLVPITASWNEDLLKSAGFRKIDCFWRVLNFAGWIAVK